MYDERLFRPQARRNAREVMAICEGHSSWEIVGQELLLSVDGEVSSIAADDVYRVQFEGETRINDVDVPSPSIGTSLNFSTLPCTCKVVLSLNRKPSSAPCDLTLAAVLQTGEQIAISEALRSDHLIIGNTWYPIEPNSYGFLRRLEITLGRSIPTLGTLADYLHILEIEDSDELVSDQTGDSLSAECISLDLAAPVVEGLRAELFPYQKRGLGWLSTMVGQDLGCVLADEMGLGKTLQIIGLLVDEIAHSRIPNLVVAPPSLLENWRREIARFAPNVSTCVHAGPRRTGFPRDLEHNELVLMSYDAIRSDLGMLLQVSWNVVVLDEAQAIKNPNAQRTIAVKRLRRRVGIAVTGTPLQNSLLDVWSLVDYCVPGLLGDSAAFRGDAGMDEQLAARTERLVTPLMLRRTVSKVGQDLPPRVDIPELLLMSDVEAQGYEDLRKNEGALGLALLQELRMYCTLPALAGLDQNEGPDLNTSAKFERLLEILAEVTANGDRAIVFTSYLKMIDILVAELPTRLGCQVRAIDGRVESIERQSRVDALNAGEVDVLVLNPQVGGTGLNITGANHVIHYNLEWNPASIDQASARAHRRGQDKTVFVHYLVYAGTVDEVIQERVARKRDLAEVAVRGTEGDAFEAADLARALAMSPLGYTKGGRFGTAVGKDAERQ